MKMKMRNLLLVFFLGFLAVVYSTPLNTVTEPEEDFMKEAEADGLILKHVHQPLLTTESSKINTTIQASQQPSFESTTGGSGGTTQPTESRGTDPTTTTQSILESTAEGSGGTTQPTESRRTDPTAIALSIFESSADGSGETEVPTFEGSGFSSIVTESRSTVSTTTVMSVQHPQNLFTANSLQSDYTSSTIPNTANAAESDVNADISRNSRLALNLKTIQFMKPEESDNTSTNLHKGHITPDWIIILAFVVGVAALVALCAAIATRDKWNRPDQAFKDETKTNSSNQKRELEMETFLRKEEPRVNGKEAEYIVIPLEDLPEKFASD